MNTTVSPNIPRVLSKPWIICQSAGVCTLYLLSKHTTLSGQMSADGQASKHRDRLDV